MSQLPPLNAIRAFEAAARHLSFKEAAEELHVTDSAVSRHISLLEDRLGVKLFLRLTRRVELTAEGKALFADVSPALSRIAMATASVARAPAHAAQIRVNAPPTLTMRWLIPRLSDFLRANPGIDVSITTSIEPVDFVTGGYDMAIRRVSEEISGLSHVRILHEMRVPVCHPSLLGQINPEDPASLTEQVLLHAKTSPSAWAEWLAEAGVTTGPSDHALHFEEMYFTVQAAANALGFAMVPAALVIDDVRKGTLAIPFPQASTRRNHYHAIFPENRSQRRALRVFCDWMAEEGGASEAWVRDELGLTHEFS